MPSNVKVYDVETLSKVGGSIHNRKYDYSKVVYKGSLLKVEIVCPEHGSFLKSPNAHINGRQGCPKCSREVLRTKRMKMPLGAYILDGRISFDGCTFPLRTIKIKKKVYHFSTVVLERALKVDEVYVSPSAKRIGMEIYRYLESGATLKYITDQELTELIGEPHG